LTDGSRISNNVDCAACGFAVDVRQAASGEENMPFPLDFDLPVRLIAQQPCDRRDHSRLLLVRRHDRTLSHHHFHELPTLLSANDLLVVNDTRVLPARLIGRRQSGGRWEGLFISSRADGTGEMLCKGRLRSGEVVVVEPRSEEQEPVELRLIARTGAGRWQVVPLCDKDLAKILDEYGHVPLPPYIRKGRDRLEDRQRYQTVYARHAGAIAAPTAGLHFTPELLERLQTMGISTSPLTLHVGLGTFQPIQDDDYTRHDMHEEWGRLPQETVQAIAVCRQRQGRVVAVGTTSVRVLETVAAAGDLQPWSGSTNLFIYPPYNFAVTDALLTNFHLPRSTLLLLVGAFAGVDLLEKAYRAAIAEEYRFFSYGDAMLIL
jgi:S-adenosylmethionine:tRNA ribosyltransferase-isomerase